MILELFVIWKLLFVIYYLQWYEMEPDLVCQLIQRFF